MCIKRCRVYLSCRDSWPPKPFVYINVTNKMTKNKNDQTFCFKDKQILFWKREHFLFVQCVQFKTKNQRIWKEETNIFKKSWQDIPEAFGSKTYTVDMFQLSLVAAFFGKNLKTKIKNFLKQRREIFSNRKQRMVPRLKPLAKKADWIFRKRSDLKHTQLICFSFLS